MNYRFGKNPPKSDYRTLRLASYLTDQIPDPPTAYSALARVYTQLHTMDAAMLFPLLANDRWGDCTIAGIAHAQTVYHGLVGLRNVMAEQSVVKLYLHLTGGVDSGLYLLDVLNYWRKTPIAGSSPLAFVQVNAHDHTHVKQAIKLFGGVYVGFQVQQGCMEDFEARKAWTPGHLTYSGHAVYITGYDADGVDVLTWGRVHRGTWAWADCCVDECFAILPPEARDAAFAPGVDLAQLQRDLAEVAQT